MYGNCVDRRALALAASLSYSLAFCADCTLKNAA